MSQVRRLLASTMILLMAGGGMSPLIKAGASPPASAAPAVSAESPRDVALKFLQLLLKGNLSGAQKLMYCPPGAELYAIVGVREGTKELLGYGYSGRQDEYHVTSFKILKEDVVGEVADVTFDAPTRKGKGRTGTLQLQRIDGDWKIPAVEARYINGVITSIAPFQLDLQQKW